MELINEIDCMQKLANKLRQENKKIGLVATMGALHQGHISLLKRARKETDIVVMSIFVNPLQFGKGEDYKEYPRCKEKDLQIAASEKVDIVFMPSVENMYKKKHLSFVYVEELSDKLCGKFRVGHFRGVTTVVAKLFNIIKPHVAYFGEKDYQQAVIIKKMVEDLNFDIKIITVPTVRNEENIALSSRLVYLSKEELKEATSIYKALLKAKEQLDAGIYDKEKIIKEAKKMLSKNIQIQYFKICDPNSLEELNNLNKREQALIAIAVKINKTRLIDNIIWRKIENEEKNLI